MTVRDYEIILANVLRASELGWPDIMEEARKLVYSADEFIEIAPPAAEVWLRRVIAEVKNDRSNIVQFSTQAKE